MKQRSIWMQWLRTVVTGCAMAVALALVMIYIAKGAWYFAVVWAVMLWISMRALVVDMRAMARMLRDDYEYTEGPSVDTVEATTPFGGRIKPADAQAMRELGDAFPTEEITKERIVLDSPGRTVTRDPSGGLIVDEISDVREVIDPAEQKRVADTWFHGTVPSRKGSNGVDH